MATRGLLMIASALLLGSALSAQDGYRIIVNTANPVSSLSKVQAQKLFLEKSVWDNGVAATPVDLLPTSSVRELFSRDVLGVPASSVSERWRQASASGAVPPPSVASDREVLAYVRLKPGAIGYVSLGADVQGVKVVWVGKAGERGQAPAASQAPVQVGGAVPAPERIAHAQPVYPVIAKAARIEGTVSVELVIGAAGNVERARVVRSVPMLDDAALSAVKQWKYSPTIVNGLAVPVSMVVHVAFAL